MNQHYVPKGYLKNFATKRSKEYYVDVFDKKEGKYFNTNIKNICSEVNLYTLDKESLGVKDLQIVEKIYANGIEPLYLKAYDILTNNKIRSISNNQRLEALLGIFQLFIRNPSFLKRILSVHKENIEKIYENQKRENAKGMSYLGEDFSFRDFEVLQILSFFEDKIIKEFKQNHLSAIGEIGNFHEDAKIEVAVITDDSEFITTDNPLIMEDLISPDSNPMMRSKEFRIALNKKTAVRLFHDNRKQLNQIDRWYAPNLSVATINESILRQSSRFIIGGKKALDEHEGLKKEFLDNTSIELKINSAKQILAKFKSTPNNAHSHKLLEELVEKYEKNGTVTPMEEYELFKQFTYDRDEFVKKILV